MKWIFLGIFFLYVQRKSKIKVIALQREGLKVIFAEILVPYLSGLVLNPM
jgi:hypothetical protein